MGSPPVNTVWHTRGWVATPGGKSNQALTGGKLNNVGNRAVVVGADLLGGLHDRLKLPRETGLVDGAFDDHAGGVSVVSDLAVDGVGCAFNSYGVGGHLRLEVVPSPADAISMAYQAEGVNPPQSARK